MSLTPDQLKARTVEIEIWLHYNSYVCSMYQLSHDNQHCFTQHMNMMIPPNRIELQIDWMLYHRDMLADRHDLLQRKEAILYALQQKKMSFKQIQRIFQISPNRVKDLKSGNFDELIIPPNGKWMPILLQVYPLWKMLVRYEFSMW